MNNGASTRQAGITLMELMIVIAVIGILAAIAYPSYQDQMRKSRRTDAKVALTEVANRLENFYNSCNTYTTELTAARPGNCAGAGLGYRLTSPEGYYNLSIAALSGNISTGYIITADPRTTGPQNGDGAFTLDSQGKRQYDADKDGTLEADEDKW